MRERPKVQEVPRRAVVARERLRRYGPGPLSEQELLTLVIGSSGGSGGAAAAWELADAVLALSDGRLSDLARLGPERLAALPGIGPAVAGRIVAAIELGRRVASARCVPEDPIMGPEDVHEIFAPSLAHLGHEEFHVLLLNSQNGPICQRQVTRGILDASLIHPREVFRDAIVLGAAALILVHNHPSGNPDPSSEDLRVTRQLASAGEQLGIPVLDHIIVAGDDFSSLAGRGCMGIAVGMGAGHDELAERRA